MRTASEIIRAAGGAPTLAQRLGIPSPHTVSAWASRGRIPAKQWQALKDQGIASLDELAALAASQQAA